MTTTKLIVAYPQPTNVAAFEKAYQEEHVPLAIDKLKGMTKIVGVRIVASPLGAPPFYRVAEVHFPSMQQLEECAGSIGGKETLAHAVKISSGGTPVIMIAEEESFSF
jgi:uncharacterized protein (TIGR02118 family)